MEIMLKNASSQRQKVTDLEIEKRNKMAAKLLEKEMRVIERQKDLDSKKAKVEMDSRFRREPIVLSKIDNLKRSNRSVQDMSKDVRMARASLMKISSPASTKNDMRARVLANMTAGKSGL